MFLNLKDAQIEYLAGFIDPRESQTLMKQLSEEVPFQADFITIFGKKHLIPRLQCWMGDPGAVYKYSGLTMKPIPWSILVKSLKDRIEQLLDVDFNSVLINLYRDGSDSNGWHADDEPELGEFPVIASLSFGVERVFQFQHKFTGGRSDILLENGSLIIMSEETQRYWKHQIAKSKRISSPRINLTFRKILH